MEGVEGITAFAVKTDRFDAMVGIDSGLERDAELDVVVRSLINSALRVE